MGKIRKLPRLFSLFLASSLVLGMIDFVPANAETPDAVLRDGGITATFSVDPSGMMAVQNAENGVDVTYTAGTWYCVDVQFDGLEGSEYGSLEFTVTTDSEETMIGIVDGVDNNKYYRNHWDESGLLKGKGKQTFAIENLAEDFSSILIFLDSTGTNTGEHKITFDGFKFIPVGGASESGNGEITIDGKFEDWDYINPIVYNNGIIASLSAFTSEDTLYLMRDISDTEAGVIDTIYFDIDGIHDNGYTSIGIDYMLQSGALYKYTGVNGGWGWDWLESDVNCNADASKAEYSIPLSALNATGEIRIQYLCLGSDWSTREQYPAGNSFLTLPKLKDVLIQSAATPITDFEFTPSQDLSAITENTMAGGTVGTLSAKGGNDKNYYYTFAASEVYGVDNDKFVIEGDKVKVKSGMLAPGSYSFYVKVKSDIKTEKKAFNIIVGKAAEDIEVTDSIFSGADGEWFAVAHDEAHKVAATKSFKACVDANALYMYVDVNSMAEDAMLYIKSDSKAGKDMSDVWANGSGIIAKVSVNGDVYRYQNADFEMVGTANVNKNAVGAEIAVDLSFFDVQGGDKLYCAVVNGEGNELPNKGEEMLSVIVPFTSDKPEIICDGDPSDWKGIESLAEGNDSLGDLYAYRDNDTLYVMTTVKNPDMTKSSALSMNILINCDNNSSTGFRHEAFVESGADLLVQNWFSNDDIDFADEKRNVECFTTTNSSFTWVKAGESNDGYCHKMTEDGDCCVEYAIPLSVFASGNINISDDLFICLDRNVDLNFEGHETPSGDTSSSGSYVWVPKYNTNKGIDVTDKSFADWALVTNAASNTSSDTTSNLYATKSSERLYTLVTNDAKDMNLLNVYVISTGDNTGYRYGEYENIDFVVRNGNLYKLEADNMLSDVVNEVWMNYYRDNVEMQLYLEDIGNPETIKIAWRGIDGQCFIPSYGGLMEVNASFELFREENYVYPTEDFASFANPYKGFVGWATNYKNYSDRLNSFDYKTTYLAFRWSEFEADKGVFNYDSIKEKYQLDYWKSEGVRINLRFVMDNPETLSGSRAGESYGEVADINFLMNHNLVKDNSVSTEAIEKLLATGNYRADIPAWLIAELCNEVLSEATDAEGNTIKNAGTFYNEVANLGGAGFSPNYKSELLISYHAKALAGMADYFDDNTITSYVMAGSLGHWAEFHTWPEGSGEFPSPSVCEKYLEEYTNNFKNVKVGIRKPYPFAAQNDFGLFNDIFGSSAAAGTDTFIGYINNGCVDMPGASAQDVEDSRMPDFWKVNYSGGEFANGNISEHLTTDGILKCLEDVRNTHITWLGPCSPADYTKKDIRSYIVEPYVMALQKLMGYNFAVEKVSKLQNAYMAGSTMAVSMTIKNEGVAPFYYEWPLELSLIDKSGNVVSSETFDIDIETILPGRADKTVYMTIPDTLSDGEYTLAMAILDKDTEEPAIRLAMEGGREDLRYPLYNVKLNGNEKATEKKDYYDNLSDNGTSNGSNEGKEEVVIFNEVLTESNYTPVRRAAIVIDAATENTEETVSEAVEAPVEIKEEATPTVDEPIENEENAVESGEETNIEESDVPLADSAKTNKILPILLIILACVAVACVSVYYVIKKKGGAEHE